MPMIYDEVKISETMQTTKIDKASGSLVIYRNFVTETGHRVRIEVSGDSGATQDEHCDCPSFKFSRPKMCKHIAAANKLMSMMAEEDKRELDAERSWS